jgi:hypothetical protein
MIAPSSTVRVIVPTWSQLAENGTTPARLIRPKVGLKPTTPHRKQGLRTEAPVSVPSAPAANPAATAAAEPLLEPPV